MYPTPSRKILEDRLAQQLTMRNPAPPQLPAPLPKTTVEKPIESENKSYDESVLAQARERGLKATAYQLEQRAQAETLKKNLLQFYCKHQFANIPVQWYGTTVYPRICVSCGKIRDSDKN
jgi:hypothetical protein